MSCPLVQYQACNHLVLKPQAQGRGDYKPDIAIMASHNLYIYIYIYIYIYNYIIIYIYIYIYITIMIVYK